MKDSHKKTKTKWPPSASVAHSSLFCHQVALVIFILVSKSSGDTESCTYVRDVSVVEGESVGLICRIRNETKVKIVYSKNWRKDGTLLYRFLYQSGNAVIDGAFSHYKGRVEKVNDNKIKLYNITKADAGTYDCIWSIYPTIAGCLNVEAKFKLTVIEPVSNVEMDTSVINIRESLNVSFNCSAEGSAPITYSLYKDLDVTNGWEKSGGHFTYYKIQRSMAGNYSCQADNKAKQPVRSKPMRINVYYAPDKVTLSASPSAVTPLQEGTQVTLTCMADGGHPTPNIRIHRADQLLVYGPHHTLHLNRSDNLVKFECVASGVGVDGQIRSNALHFNITFPPEAVKITPASHDSIVEVEKDIVLICKTTICNPPLSLEWLVGGSTVHQGTEDKESGRYNSMIQTSTLTVKAERKLNKAEFLCRVRSMPVIKSSYNVTVLFPPSNVQRFESPTGAIKYGSLKELKCTTNISNPASVIKWTRDGIDVTSNASKDQTDGSFYSVITASSIFITTTKDHNNAVYVCTALYRNKKVLNETFKLNVTFPHTVSVSASSESVKEGESVTLTCLTEGGNPETVDSYHWSRNTTYNSGLERKLPSQKSVTLTYVTFADNGSYSCTAKNAAGVGQGRYHLNVLFSPKLKPHYDIVKNISSEYGKNVTFELQVVANPPPMFSWMRKRMSSTSRSNLPDKAYVQNTPFTSTLFLRNISQADFATYFCNVANDFGNVEFSFNIKPAVPPSRPQNPNTNYTTAVSATLSWLPGFNGGFTQTFSVRYRIQGEIWPTTPQINNIRDLDPVQCKVQDLQPDTTYEFQVMAINSRDVGRNYSDFTKTIIAKTRKKPTVSKFIVERDPDSSVATVTWNKLEEVDNYKIVVEACVSSESEASCHNVSVPGSATQTEIKGLHNDKSYLYRYLILDHDEIIHESSRFTEKDPETHSLGIIIGIICALVCIGISTIVFIIFKFRKAKKPEPQYALINKKPKRQSHTVPETVTVEYATVDKERKKKKVPTATLR